MILWVLLILFIATFIRSSFGFGEALIAVPLLSLLMPVEVAAPATMLVSITVAGIVVAQDWRHVHFRSAGLLTLASMFGIPLGLMMLLLVSEWAVKAILAVIIIGFSAYSLLRPNLPHLKNDRFAFLFGFLAGIMGGSYGIGGPPLVIYGALRNWSPQHFRATLQGYFLPASVMAMFGYWLSGLWTTEVSRYYLISLPAVVVATLLGRTLNSRLSGPSFLKYVHIGLIVVGLVLMWKALA